MKRIYFLLAFTMIMCSAIGQVTLPRATFNLTFEGAENVSDFGGTQIGDGELRQSEDPNFGTYYQNCPNNAVATKATNYLRIELGDGLTKAGKKTMDKSISLGFWVNPTIANTIYPNISYYYSVFYSFYNAGNRGYTSKDSWSNGVWSQNTRGWLQINDWGGHWDDFGNEENVNGMNQISIDYLAQRTTENVIENGEGEQETITTPTGFNDNWHHIALVLSVQNNSATIYVDGVIFNQWTCKADFLSGSTTLLDNLEAYSDLYLGGVAQWNWNDPDPAFAYDDFTIYAGGLDTDQIELIMKIKSGDVDDDTRLAIAKDNYDTAMSELEDFLGRLENYSTLTIRVEEILTQYEESTEANPSIESYNEAANAIRSSITEIEKIVDAADAVKSTIASELAFAESSNYPGKSDYVSALSNCSSQISDANTLSTCESVSATIANAKGKYVVSQELPSDGSGIDATALILHPWFCNTEAEPTLNGDGNFNFPYMAEHEYANNTTPSDYNSSGWVNGNTFTVDDARVNWTMGRITWNNWHAKTNLGTLNIHQDLRGLPEGYYSVSADWITNYEPSTQHTYAQNASSVKSSAYLDNVGWDTETWTTLTTDKILVGPDGLLTVGGESSTTGAAYSGWFCVTNFKLTYYGTTYDLSGDLALKKSEAEGIINELILQGDILNANTRLSEIMSNSDTYVAIGELTKFIAELKNIYSDEENIAKSIDDFSLTTSSSPTVSTVLSASKAHLASMVNSEDATIDIASEVSLIISATNAYTSTLASAETWESENITSFIKSQLESLETTDAMSSPTSVELTSYNTSLVNVMKSSLPSMNASETSPVDATVFLQNPSFSGDTFSGWIYNDGVPACYYSEVEFYNCPFVFYQEIENMPTGYYLFSVQGFYRDGSNADAYARFTATDNEDLHQPTNQLNAEIIALNFDSSSPFSYERKMWKKPIMSWANFFTVGEEFNGYYSPNINDVEADDILYFANTMEGANYLFETKKLHENGNTVMFNLSAPGSMTVGIQKTETINDDWTIFDNCHLYYLGQATPDGYIEGFHLIDEEPSDVNSDGLVNITDVVLVINNIASGVYDVTYDVDKSGHVNITDVVEIINTIAGVNIK